MTDAERLDALATKLSNLNTMRIGVTAELVGFQWEPPGQYLWRQATFKVRDLTAIEGTSRPDLFRFRTSLVELGPWYIDCRLPKAVLAVELRNTGWRDFVPDPNDPIVVDLRARVQHVDRDHLSDMWRVVVTCTRPRVIGRVAPTAEEENTDPNYSVNVERQLRQERRADASHTGPDREFDPQRRGKRTKPMTTEEAQAVWDDVYRDMQTDNDQEDSET